MRALSHLRTAFALGPERPAIARGLRAAAATVVPIVLADALHRPVLAWVALGGWMTSLADQGGPYRGRAVAMGSFAIVGSLSCFAAAAASGHAALAVLLMFVWALGAGLARAYGDVPTTLGNLTAGVFVGTMGSPAATIVAAEQRALLVLVGAAWAMVLSLVLWPVHPFGPAQRSLARCYDALIDYGEAILAIAREAASATAGAPATLPSPGPVRTAIEDARLAIVATRGRRHGPSAPMEQLLALLERSESIFISLIAIAEELEMVRTTGAAEHAKAAAALVAQVREELAEEGWTGEWRTAALPAERQPRRVDPRALFDPKSLVMRHALRLAIATSAAVWLTSVLGIKRGYWVTITILVVLQPYSGATFKKSAQRVAGSVAGGVIAALLAASVHNPLLIAALMFPLSVGAVAFLPVNYTVFVVLLTPVFVLMTESAPGDWRLAFVRIANSLLGGALALASAYLLWPTWEKGRLSMQLADAVDGLREYLAAIASAAATGDDSRVADVRRRTGLALNNADASFQRLIDEANPQSAIVAAMMNFLLHCRRLAGVITVLGSNPRAAAELAAAARVADELLADVSAALREERTPPAPEPDARSYAPRSQADRLAQHALAMRAAVATIAAASARESPLTALRVAATVR